MTPEELQALQAIEAKMQEATKGFIKIEDVNTAIEATKADLVSVESLKKLEDIVATQGNLINDLKTNPSTPEAVKSVGDQFAEQLEKNPESFK